MRSFTVCCAALLVLTSCVAAEALTIQFNNRAAYDAAAGPQSPNVDFEGIAPDGGFVDVTPVLTVGGIEFRHVATTPYLIVVSDTYLNGSNLYDFGTGDSMQAGSTGYSGAGSYLQATFPTPVYSFGLDLFTVNAPAQPYTATVTIGLENGDVVATVASIGKSATFLGAITTPAIEWIRISSTDSAAYVNIDNVTYGTTQVPVPEGGSSVAFLGLGLIVLTSFRRLM